MADAELPGPGQYERVFELQTAMSSRWHYGIDLNGFRGASRTRSNTTTWMGSASLNATIDLANAHPVYILVLQLVAAVDGCLCRRFVSTGGSSKVSLSGVPSRKGQLWAA